jgi:hypothetical protein
MVLILMLVVGLMVTRVVFAETKPEPITLKTTSTFTVEKSAVSVATFKPQSTGTSSTYALEVVYDFTKRESYAGISQPIGKLTDVLGTKLTLDTFGFVGSSTKGVPVAGLGARAKIPVAKEATVYAGAIALQSAVMRIALYFGYSYQPN